MEMNPNDFLGSLGYLALGSRLKRAGTLLQTATQNWLQAAGCDVPAAHMPLLAALDRAGSVSLGTVVDMLGVAQPGVSRMADSLQAAGWITVTTDLADKRVRILALTPAGQTLVAEAKVSLWPVVQAAVGELCTGLTGPFAAQLSDLERKLSAGAFERALAGNGTKSGNRRHVVA